MLNRRPVFARDQAVDCEKSVGIGLNVCPGPEIGACDKCRANNGGPVLARYLDEELSARVRN